MNARFQRAWVLVTTLALAGPAIAQGGQTRLQRVLVLPVGGRVSVVLEMSGAPGSVSSRRISGDLFEVDAGPVRVDHPQAYAAPAGTTLISTVVIDGSESDQKATTLRARITLRERCETAVRVQGNRVYVDISSVGNTAAQAVTAPASPRAGAKPAVAPAKAPVRDDAAARSDLRAALSRFGELLPFVTSAAAMPSPSVLGALAAPLASLDQAVRALPSPESLRPAEGLLASAVAAASKAVDPAYLGDRVEQVRQAAIFFQQAKVEDGALQGGTP